VQELARIRRQGYAIDNSEYVTYTGCVGAAILDGRRYPVGAIWMHGLLPHLQGKGFDALGRQVAQAAGQISTNMQRSQYQKQREYADFVIDAVRQQLVGELSSRADVRALAARYHVSYSTLGHWFKDRKGCGPSQYQLRMRLEAAMGMSRETDRAANDIAEDVGFGDHVQFFKMFKKRFAHPPLHFRGR
jgi:transcriptional regulator GlxA family with amidase domain